MSPGILLLLLLLLFPMYGPMLGLVVRMWNSRGLPKGRCNGLFEAEKRRRKVVIADTIIFLWSVVIGGFECIGALVYLGGSADLMFETIRYFGFYIVIFLVAAAVASLHAAIWATLHWKNDAVANKYDFMRHSVCTIIGYFLIVVAALSAHVLLPPLIQEIF